MTPLKLGGLSLETRKQAKKPMEILEVKEVVRVPTPAPQAKFHQDYGTSWTIDAP
jgi:hypothetical protein